MPAPSRYIALTSYVPSGPLSEAAFALRESPWPEPGEGQVVLRPLALSVDPYMRSRMTGADTYFLPQFRIGRPVMSLGVGRVIASRDTAHPVGQLVFGLMDWADACIWTGAGQLEGGGLLQALAPAPAKLSHTLGVLGTNGLTAYFGMLEVARPRRGETVLISGAAGGIGTLAGQIAKIMGARVIGLAGSQAKLDVLTGQLGFDAALNYRSPDWSGALRELAPHGPDIYFDNVGGAISQAVMGMMERPARVIECGQIATYEEPGGGWTVDIRPIHSNGLIFQSFTTAHFWDFAPAARAQLAHWIAGGRLKALETEHHGLENAPHAILGLMRGENLGKMVVTLDEV